ncbi:unnamed protein product, partial [Prorocentrum cordatum]
ATTIPLGGEPAWHRRADSQSAHARVLLRLGKAAELLRAHHSAQPRMRGLLAGLGLAASKRTPLSSLGRGRHAGADKVGTQRVADAARVAAKDWQSRKPAPPAREMGQRRSQRGGQQPAGPGGPSYAEMAKRFLPSPSAGATAPAGDAPVPPPVDAGPQQELTPLQQELRHWRERGATAHRYGAEQDVAECDRQIQVLEQAAQAARPRAVRVQAAADSQRAGAAKLQAATEDLAEARRAVQHFECEAAQAQQALRQADAALAAAQAEAAPVAAPPAAAPLTEAGVAAAFDTLAAAIAVLQQQVGQPAEAAEARPPRLSSSFALSSPPRCVGPLWRPLLVVRRRPRAVPAPPRLPLRLAQAMLAMLAELLAMQSRTLPGALQRLASRRQPGRTGAPPLPRRCRQSASTGARTDRSRREVAAAHLAAEARRQ